MFKTLMLATAAFVTVAATGAGAQQAAPSTTVVVEGQKSSHRTPAWIKGESQHFIIYSDARRADVEALIEKLERFHYTMRAAANLQDQAEAPAPKLELYYVANPKELAIADPAKPDYGIGLYKSCEDGEQAYGAYMYYRPDSKAVLEKQPENEGMSYVFQAYARHFLDINDAHRKPTWFLDGFATYFSTARFDGDTALVGMAPEPFAAYLERVSVSGDLQPALSYKDVLTQDDPKGYSDAGTDGVRTDFQARSWILTHWILASPDNRKKLGAYLDALSNGDAPATAFSHAFGLSQSALESQLSSYLHGHHLMAAKLTLAMPALAAPTFETLPVSANKLLLWQSALKACPSDAYGAKLLGDIRAEAPQYPQSELAQLTLARAEILYGDPRKALPYLAQQTVAQPNDFEAQALLGRAQLAIALASTGDARVQAFAAAKAAMVKAAGINPNDPANIHAYYRAQVVSYDLPNEAATSAAELAWQLAPNVDAYALAAGLSYAHLGRKADALRVLQTVADDPRGRALAGTARDWIRRITAGAPDADIVAAMKADEHQSGGGRAQWTLSSHDVLQALTQAAAAQEIEDLGDLGGIPVDGGPPAQ